MRVTLFVAFILSSLVNFSQVSDDFSDDEISNNPTWFGQTSKFEITDPLTAGNGCIAASALDDDHVLHSIADENDAIITTASNIVYGEWQFSVADGNGWSISSSNDYFIILISDDSTTSKLKDGASLNFNGYYLRYDGSSDDQFILYKQTGTTETSILDTDFPPIIDDASASDGYSVKITRNIEGLWTVYIDSVFDGNASTQRGPSVTENTHQLCNWFGISTNITNNSNIRILYFDNLVITKDFDSEVTEPDVQVSAGNISSIADIEAEAIDVFKFKFTDSGSGDGLPGFLNSVSIKNTHPVNGADWTDHIQGLVLNDGTADLLTDSVKISDDTIIVYLTDDELIIDDGTDKEITLSIYLNDTAIEDGKKLQFYIDADDHGFVAGEKGSELLDNFAADITSNEFIIEISGTDFLVTSVPDTVGINQNFNLGISAIDENENYDIDATDQVSLGLNQGSGNLTSLIGLSKTLSSGTINWNDLKYDKLGTFSITASATGYSNNTTDDIIAVGDTTSFIEDPDEQISFGSISSLTDSPDEAISVFKFKVTDAASGDILPTDITQIVIKNANPVNGAGWMDHIAGTHLFSNSQITIQETIITDTEITFSINSGNLIINDNESLTIELKIYLAENNLDDNKVLQFMIDADDHGFIADNSGSTLKIEIDSDIFSNEFTIDVIATKISIIDEPEMIGIYSDFTLAVQSIDDNGNLDSDNNEEITLSNYSGIGAINSEIGLTQNLANGELTFNDLQYTVAEEFRLAITPNSLIDTLTDTILAVLPFYEFSFESGNIDSWLNTDDWTTSTTDPIDGIYSLKHNLNGTSGESYISHSAEMVSYNSGTVHWQVIMKNGNWDPTNTNKFGFYIMSDSENLVSDTTNGYVVGVNLSGSNDLLTLWKVTNNTFNELITSSFNWGSNDLLSVQLSRSAKGNWNLKYANNSSFTNLIDAGNANDNEFEFNSYFGSYFKYTTTRAGDFWCDEIKIYETDDPPFLKSADAVDSVTLKVVFSEDITEASAENTANFSIVPGATASIDVISATLSTENPNEVYLTVSELVTDNYSLTVSTISDTAGYILAEETTDFTYIITPETGDVVINEIMFDPSPPVYLPEYDFIELFNATEYPVYLHDWILQINETEYIFSDDTILADSFLIVCPSTAVTLFETYGRVSGLIGTSDLTNNGKKISLISPESKTINSVHYNSTWFNDPLKENGGWSLEKIDPLNFCLTSANWQASTDTTGGTPGRTNSIKTENTDSLAAEINTFEIINSKQLVLEFNEIVDTSQALNTSNYSLNHSIGNPDSVVMKDDSQQSFILYFSSPFPDADTSNLTVTGIYDLCANEFVDTTLQFIFYIPKTNDIVVSEIMADPSPIIGLPEYEFLELANITFYNFNLKNWKLKVGNYEVTLPEIYMPADSFIILTSTSGYLAFDTLGLTYGVTSFPSLSNSGTQITLKDSSGAIISNVTYSDTWYNDPLKEDGGWSLEKIDPANNCSTSANWTASDNENGGTPGHTNSVNAPNIDNSTPLVESIEIESANKLKVTFNEIIDTSTALNSTYYFVDHSLGNPDSVVIANEELTTVYLYFANDFPDEDSCEISITGIGDLCGNTIADTTLDFLYYIVKPFDVIINEIMADPTPIVGLPDYEYLEIHNTTIYNLKLTGWILQTGSSTVTLPQLYLPTDSFLILTSNSGYSAFDTLGLAYGVTSFPSLTNSGTKIILKDSSGTPISNVQYSNTWYNDPLKAEGGWSLEKFDPLNNCSTTANWTASDDQSGGTPGRINSVDAPNIDNSPPLVESLEIISANQLKVNFNEIIDTATALIPVNYLVNNSIGNPDSVKYSDDFLSVDLYFTSDFPDEDTCEITISGINDLCENSIADTTLEFQYYIVKPFDVVISEIMADPTPVVGLPDYEFIELTNLTAYNLKLQDWKLKVGTNEVMLPEIIIPADSFLILTSNSGSSSFDTLGLVYGVTSFPSLPNSGAEIYLKDSLGTIISKIEYSVTWYNDPLKEDGGWSLEKIDPLNNCATSANWTASDDISGGTPGRINSVDAPNIDNSPPFVESLEIISANQLKVNFNEIIDTASTLIPTNYLVNNSIGNPDSVHYLDDFLSVDLYFTSDFPDEDSCEIIISGISDLCENSIANTTLEFLYYIVKPFDVVINEIMADPEPVVGLPEYDYLELFNQSGYTINLLN